MTLLPATGAGEEGERRARSVDEAEALGEGDGLIGDDAIAGTFAEWQAYRAKQFANSKIIVIRRQ